MVNTGFLHRVVTEEGFVAANTLTKVLHITQNDLADVTGLSLDSVSKSSRCKNRSTQARLRDTEVTINHVSEWSDRVGRAFAWFRSQPLPLFGDKTAEDLVKEAHAEAVKAYLTRIADGGYA